MKATRTYPEIKEFKKQVLAKYVGDKFKALRLSYNLSQRAVAECAKVSLQAYTSWENGRTVPRRNNIYKIIEEYNLSLNDVIGKTMQRQLGF